MRMFAQDGVPPEGAGGRDGRPRRVRRLREEGVSGLVPRSSRPKSHPGRQWTMADARRVLEVRREMRWAGKARIAPELAERRPGGAPSQATVGRILRWAVETGRAQPCSICEGWAAAKRRHAVRPHDDAHINGKTFKEFRAACPATRRQHARVYSSATAHTARAFLGEAAKRLDIGAVQVDGCSAFMRHSWRSGFEDECRKRGLPLLVLPPRSRSSTASSNAPTAPCASSAGASTGTASPAPR